MNLKSKFGPLFSRKARLNRNQKAAKSPSSYALNHSEIQKMEIEKQGNLNRHLLPIEMNTFI